MVHVEEPPPSRQHHSDIPWTEIVATINEAAGRFHLIGEFSPGVATHIRQGRYKAFIPDGTDDPQAYMAREYEVTTRNVPGEGRQRIMLYIRKLA